MQNVYFKLFKQQWREYFVIKTCLGVQSQPRLDVRPRPYLDAWPRPCLGVRSQPHTTSTLYSCVTSTSS